MKTLIASVSLLSLLFVQSSTANLSPLRTSVGTVGQQRARTQEAIRKDFAKARSLLAAKNIPFDPDILLTPHWRMTLKSTLDQMPDLQQVRRGSNRLKDVEIAHTLYLPEKVRLEGDTVILVRNLIFDGNNAVIRGPYNIYVFPIDVAGVLGTSFDAALARARGETGIRFINASWIRNRSLPLMPVIRGGTITINTNGLGRADWLESQRAMAGTNGRMIKVGFFPQGENKNGAYGGDGDWGLEGAPGPSPTPNPGATGANGTCGSSSTVNGGIGGPGGAGTMGKEARVILTRRWMGATVETPV